LRAYHQGPGSAMRFFIFMICGPLVAHCVTTSLLTPLSATDFVLRTLQNLHNIVLFGVIPAIPVWILDATLNRPSAWRAAWCAAAGWASSYLPLLALMAVFNFWPGWSGFLKWGLGGLVAGAVCSLLSSKLAPRETY
jgi:hypothetical protein